MEFVRLVDYIKEGELFEKIEGEYDQVVSDYDFSKFDVKFFKINKISDINKIDTAKKTLFILDKLLLDNIFYMLGKVDSFAVIDMNFGITGYGKKLGYPKKIVHDLIDLGIEIYEPYDLLSFLLELSGNDGKKYFRVTNFDLPENISNGERKSYISLDGFGFDGGNLSIVTTGSMLAEIVRFGNLLKENGLNSEIIVLNKLHDFDSNQFGNNKNFVFIVDGKSLDYHNFLIDSFGMNLKVILPKYENLSTVLDEYILESADFSAENLLNQIL